MPPLAPPQCHAATRSIPSSLHPGFAPCAQTWVGVGIAWAAVHVTWAPSAPDAIRAPCERHPSSARAAERAGRRWLPGTGRAHARAPRPLIAPSRPPGPAAAATMDFGWPAAPTSAGGACSDLNLLQDGLLIDLDDKTLQVGGPGRRGGPTGRALVTAAAAAAAASPQLQPGLEAAKPCPCPPPTQSLAAAPAAVPHGWAVRRLRHLHRKRSGAAGRGGQRQRHQARSGRGDCRRRCGGQGAAGPVPRALQACHCVVAWSRLGGRGCGCHATAAVSRPAMLQFEPAARTPARVGPVLS